MAAAAPQITGLSPTSLDRSGRLRIFGAGFGPVQGAGQVLIDGTAAFVTRWADGDLTAYVPEAAALGSVPVQVVNAAGASNQTPLMVSAREPSGRVRWRFAADADYIDHRPAVGSDGTIYAVDINAHLYALAPDGGLRWIFDAALGEPALGEGPVAVGPDDTVYVAANPLGQTSTIVAVHPDGSLRWVYTECCDQGIIAGPSLGPDGNVYAVSDLGGLGAFSLSADGQLLWDNPGSPAMWMYGGLGAEIVFGASHAGGAADRLYTAFDRQFDDHLWGLSLAGAQAFSVPTGSTEDPFSQQQAQPAVGIDGSVYLSEFNSVTGWGLQAFTAVGGARLWRFAPGIVSGMGPPGVGTDGVIYVARDLVRLHAVKPDGTQRWEYDEAGIIDEGPVASPANDLVLYGGRPSFGRPGFVKAVSTSGCPLWQVNLPNENGGQVATDARPLFAPDAATAYVGTVILGDPEAETYCYLYAIDTSGAPGIVLSQTPLVRGDVATFTVQGALPGETVVFLASRSGPGIGPCLSQLGGLCLDLAAPLANLGSAVAGGDGIARLDRIIPADAPLLALATQAVIQRGPGGAASLKSNALAEPIQP